MTGPLASSGLARDGMVEGVRRLLNAGAIYGSSMPRGLLDITIVLKLFVNGELGHELCVKQVLAESDTSATGTLRRIESLEAAGLVCRQSDGNDARRVRVRLTERGRNMVIAMVEQLYGPVAGVNDAAPRLPELASAIRLRG